MATKTQIQMIHIAKHKLQLSEDNYRACLSAFDASSSKELSVQDAKELILRFETMGFKKTVRVQNQKSVAKYGYGEKKYEELEKSRPIEYAKEYAPASKLRKIEAMWRENSRLKTDESLRKMIKRIAHVDDITFLTKEQADKVINAIGWMK